MSLRLLLTGLGCLLLLRTAAAVEAMYTADFLTLGTGAAAAAQGGAWGTSKASATSFYWNPALVLDDRAIKLYAESVPLFDGLSTLQTAAAQVRLRTHWALSLGLQMQLDDGIPRYGSLATDRDIRNPADRSTGQPNGSFESISSGYTAGVSREFWFDVLMGSGLVRNVLPARLAVGASWRVINQELDDVAASASGLDLGVKLIIQEPVEKGTRPGKELILALALQNLYSQDLEWDTGRSESLELNVKSGVAWHDQFHDLPLDYRLALERDSGWDGTWHLGGELGLFETLYLRAGTQGEKLSSMDGTVGAGVQWRWVQVDYAFLAHDLGGSHRVSLEFGF
jgi:hypothetical protein